MRNIIIPSVLHPKERAYRLTSDYNYSGRGNAPLSQYIEQFDTYGDGTCQHSGAWCAQWSELADVCLSITQAVCADPLNDAWHQLGYITRETSHETLRFALGIKYREDRETWYSLTERKISSSESKRYDKRWERVEPWMDGKIENALSILLRAWDHLDWIQKLCVARDLFDVAEGCVDWHSYFKPTADLTGDWHQAFHAFRAVCEAVHKLDYAKGAAEASIGNFTRSAETAKAA